MAKRKKTEDTANRKQRPADGSRPSKRVRKEAGNKESLEGTNPVQETSFSTSVLRDDDRAFPRGGAEAITPFERKKIQVQATRDVLFEESGQKRPIPDGGSEFDEDLEEIAHELKAKRQKKSRKQPLDQLYERMRRVEGLKPRRLHVGDLVLGRISRVTNSELLVDLPNNLTGHVNRVGICGYITREVEAAVGDLDSENSDQRPSSERNLPDLQLLFRVGQFLRAAVRSNGLQNLTVVSSKTKKRIELTLDPTITNQGISSSKITVNTTIQASVVSVEDHGVIMDMGLGENSPKGFMSSKEIPSNFSYSELRPGMVFLCLVTGQSSNGRVIKLSAASGNAKNARESGLLLDPKTVEVLLPGTAVQISITDTNSSSLIGSIVGSIKGTVDRLHTGAGPFDVDVENRYKKGTKTAARIIFLVTEGDAKLIGLSLLDHILELRQTGESFSKEANHTLQDLPVSSIVENARVAQVSPSIGIYLDIGSSSGRAFVHISRVSDDHVEMISRDTGPYQINSKHRTRLLSYNAFDMLYSASMQRSVLQKKFLRVEDVKVGELVQAKAKELIITAAGVVGLAVDLEDGLDAFVPETHLSDVHLEHPERRFKSGRVLTARVLAVDLPRSRIRLTLKRSYLSEDTDPWTDMKELKVGAESPATITKLLNNGAIVHFFGHLRGFLPISEMGEAYVQSSSEHFRLGQTVNVRAVSIDTDSKRLIVSCRTSSNTRINYELFETVKLGDVISGTITEQSMNDFTVELRNGSCRASLPFEHLDDCLNNDDIKAAIRRYKIGSRFSRLIVIKKNEKTQSIIVSNKPGLVKASKEGKFPTQLDGLNCGDEICGYVQEITEIGVFIRFGGRLDGLLHKSEILPEKRQQAELGVHRGMFIKVFVKSVDFEKHRLALTEFIPSKPNRIRPAEDATNEQITIDLPRILNSVDARIQSLPDLSPGIITKAKIKSIKDTQLNVVLADNVQGRIDCSEVFVRWSDIKNSSSPLREFKRNQILDVRILGIHDARNHRFLPISHRLARVPVFELSAKQDPATSISSLEELKDGSCYIGFVNNITESALWISLSPVVRGRIASMDVSNDLSICNNLDRHFSIGQATRVWVKSKDTVNGKLDLTTKSNSDEAAPLTYDDLVASSILAGRVTKSNDRGVIVQLSPNIIGHIGLLNLADNYDEAKPSKFRKNDLVRCCILAVDVPNKRADLSVRPSKVLSSSLPIRDPMITDLSQLKVNDKIRGFIKNVADIGLFIDIGHKITAFARVAELSDQFVKDWKALFQIDQLVEGKIILIDETSKSVQMSLKQSVLSSDYVPPLTFNDMVKGKIVTGKIRKVEDFGVFILIDNSHNVSGLCHRNEMADGQVHDVRKLYTEGDRVKAVVLNVNTEKRRLAFGLKASYLDDLTEVNDEEDDDTSGAPLSVGSDHDVLEDLRSDFQDVNDGISLGFNALATTKAQSDQPWPTDLGDLTQNPIVDRSDGGDSDSVYGDEGGLSGGGFEWNIHLTQSSRTSTRSPSPSTATDSKEKFQPDHDDPSFIYEDLTATLNSDGPSKPADFERLLLTSSDDPSVWIQYMAWYVNSSDIDQARTVAERGLAEISIRRQAEKLDLWTAWLNLEVAYGDEASVETVFERACQHTDKAQCQGRLKNIYVSSGMYDKAEALYDVMVKSPDHSGDPHFWISYASFLFTFAKDPTRARALLPRARQSLAPSTLVHTKGGRNNKSQRVPPKTVAHEAGLLRRLLVSFATLEFKTPTGDAERGRTALEELIASRPRLWDQWDVLLSIERGRQEWDRARHVYERMTRVGAAVARSAVPWMKRKRAERIFLDWENMEREAGDVGMARRVDRVRSRSKEYVTEMEEAKARQTEEGKATAL